MFWPLIAFMVVTFLIPVVFRATRLIRNRRREPGDDTLWDGMMKDRAKVEMTLRRGHRDPFKTSKM